MSIIIWILKVIARILGFSAGVTKKVVVNSYNTAQTAIPQMSQALQESYKSGQSFELKMPDLTTVDDTPGTDQTPQV